MLWLADSLFGPRYEREIARARAARAEAFAWAFTAAWRGLKAAFRGLAVQGEKYRQRRLMRAAIRELNALDDRLLRDIGLVRGDIPAVAADLVYGKPQTHTTAQSSGRQRAAETASSQDADQRRAEDKWRRAA